MRWSQSKFCSRRLLCLCLLTLWFLTGPSPVVSDVHAELSDLSGVNVAIYNGTGVMISSRIALTKMFGWTGASVVNATASQIRDGFLNDYDILVVPGGSEGTANTDLGSEGKEKVQDFVYNGGSYFGICGGATFGATYLRLINCFMSPVNEPGSLIHMTTMHINQSSTGPDLSDLSENFTTMYYGSQYFTPQYGTSFHRIATYDFNDKAGMIADTYGYGTVFLSSPHPEYEENSDRDGTTFGDANDDPDSEWDLLFRVSQWLIEASTEEPPDSTTTPTSTQTPTPTPTSTPLNLPLVAVASTGVLMVMLVVAVLYRRAQLQR